MFGLVGAGEEGAVVQGCGISYLLGLGKGAEERGVSQVCAIEGIDLRFP